MLSLKEIVDAIVVYRKPVPRAKKSAFKKALNTFCEMSESDITSLSFHSKSIEIESNAKMQLIDIFIKRTKLLQHYLFI